MNRRGWALFGIVLLVGAVVFWYQYDKTHHEDYEEYPSVQKVDEQNYIVRINSTNPYDSGIWIKPGSTIRVQTMVDTPQQPFFVKLGSLETRAKLMGGWWDVMLFDIDKSYRFANEFAESYQQGGFPYIITDEPQKIYIRVDNQATVQRLVLHVNVINKVSQ